MKNQSSKSSGDAGAVKRTALRPQWLSACEGSNPSPRMKKMENTSKTKIKKRLKKKKNPEIVETIVAANKSKTWGKVAGLLAKSRKNYSVVNLDKIDEVSKEADTIIIVGKVLGSGDIKKKVRVCAVGFSKGAVEKIKKAKGEAVSLLDEINKNVKAEGIKIIK